jgi:cell division septum initiation protein DivIVA
MSEYQYYEFQAVDRPLTEKQMQELRSYSTRARITRTSFVNDYSWGNFKGNPDGWMEKYFDAFLYLANWGTHVFKLRLPLRLLDLKTAQQYCVGDSASAWESRGNVILSFGSDEEGDWDWIEGEGHLSSLIPVRAELARGDLRALYLGWLLCVQNHELDDEALEPPVPPGLGQLSASLSGFADFLRIDGDLLDVAAEASEIMGETRLSRKEVHAWVASLSAGEKDDILTGLVVDEDSAVLAELLQRFLKRSTGGRDGSGTPTARRTVGELLEAAEVRAEERRQAEARKRAQEAERRQREAQIARAKYLDKIAAQQPKLWAQIEGLIATKQPKRYDEAVQLLIDLRDLTQREGKGDKFRTRMESIRAAHARKPSFLDRLRKAGL